MEFYDFLILFFQKRINLDKLKKRKNKEINFIFLFLFFKEKLFLKFYLSVSLCQREIILKELSRVEFYGWIFYASYAWKKCS